MNTPSTRLPSTRREFLKLGVGGIGLLAFSRVAPSFLVESALAETPRPEKDRSILVLVQLAGGNDGLNTLVPYADPHYRRLRPTLGLAKEQLVTINDRFALHTACTPLHRLLQDGKLGIVQNVGYPTRTTATSARPRSGRPPATATPRSRRAGWAATSTTTAADSPAPITTLAASTSATRCRNPSSPRRTTRPSATA